MEWYFTVLKRYGDFAGRAHRTEFWMFIIINLLVAWVIGQMGQAIGIGAAQGVYAFIVLLPTLAVAARRLHDTGLSGWWQLLWLIPFVGQLAMVFLMARAGVPGDNRYGPQPPAV